MSESKKEETIDDIFKDIRKQQEEIERLLEERRKIDEKFLEDLKRSRSK